MGKVIWAKNAAFQDEDQLWFRSGFDSESGCRHLLVSVTREGLDSVSTQGVRFAHIHFWQLEVDNDVLGHNVVYFKEDPKLLFGQNVREHVYPPNTVYESSGSIFFSDQMKSKMMMLMKHEPWFNRSIFEESVRGVRKVRLLATLEGTRQAIASELQSTKFEAHLRRGTVFLADPMKLREAAFELRNFQQQLRGYVVEMDIQVYSALLQARDSKESSFFFEQQLRWQATYSVLEELLADLLRIAEYVDRKASETQAAQ